MELAECDIGWHSRRLAGGLSIFKQGLKWGKTRTEEGKLQSVLFVRTENIFRSIAAEHALKVGLGVGTSCVASSAAIDVKPQSVHDWVRTKLREKGADSTTHVQRQLSRELVKAADSVVAMEREYQVSFGNNLDETFPCFVRSVSATISHSGPARSDTGLPALLLRLR